MNEFETEAVLTSLKDMFKSSHFSICTVDKCLTLTNAIPNDRDYKALSAIHCVNWSEMNPKFRQTVFDKTLEVVFGEGFDLSALDMIYSDESKNYVMDTRNKLKKLLNLK